MPGYVFLKSQIFWCSQRVERDWVPDTGSSNRSWRTVWQVASAVDWCQNRHIGGAFQRLLSWEVCEWMSRVQEWVFGQTVCQLYYATTGLNWFTAVFTVTVLSADRYAAVCHALSSTPYRTPTVALTASACIWLLSLLVVTPVYVYAKTVCSALSMSAWLVLCFGWMITRWSRAQ